MYAVFILLSPISYGAFATPVLCSVLETVRIKNGEKDHLVDSCVHFFVFITTVGVQ